MLISEPAAESKFLAIIAQKIAQVLAEFSVSRETEPYLGGTDANGCRGCPRGSGDLGQSRGLGTQQPEAEGDTGPAAGPEHRALQRAGEEAACFEANLPLRAPESLTTSILAKGLHPGRASLGLGQVGASRRDPCGAVPAGRAAPAPGRGLAAAEDLLCLLCNFGCGWSLLRGQADWAVFLCFTISYVVL